MAMAGAWLGFLIHNRNRRAFMGDTGSLAMGAALTAVALLSDSLWPLLVMGGVSRRIPVRHRSGLGVQGHKRNRWCWPKDFSDGTTSPPFRISGISERTVVPCFWLATIVWCSWVFCFGLSNK